MSVNHLHLVILGEVYVPPTNPEVVKKWMSSLVEKIGMKKLIEPQAVYVEAVGNRGMTSCVLIETSHIAWHVWDEEQPGMLQFDLYTCGELDSDLVYKEVANFFGLGSYTLRVFDRSQGDLDRIK
jgi:S-adenosylmethionine/arginine decarboxylase-like enzyme